MERGLRRCRVALWAFSRDVSTGKMVHRDTPPRLSRLKYPCLNLILGKGDSFANARKENVSHGKETIQRRRTLPYYQRDVL